MHDHDHHRPGDGTGPAHSHGGHGHGHVHGPGAAGAGDRRVAVAVAVNVVLSVAQVVGGVLAGSIALIADALHNFSDALSLILALVARRIARKKATPDMSFGYGRAEVISALVNYTTLILISIWLAVEAMLRFFDPVAVNSWVVIALASLALAVNALTAVLTWRMSKESVNIRAAFLHNLSDAGVSVAVILGGVAILALGWTWVDPAVTLAISAVIVGHAATEIGPVIRILMLGIPDGTDVEAIRARIRADEAVEDLHHVHFWAIDEHRSSLEAHLVVRDGSDFTAVAQRVKRLLRHEFGLAHATFEIETRSGGCSGGDC